MASQFIGADPKQLDDLAATFAATASRLGAIHGTVETQVKRSRWEGSDADEFRARWSGQSKASFTRVIDLLETQAEALRANAEEQRQTSQANSGAIDSSGKFSGGGGGGGGGGGWGDDVFDRARDVNDIAGLGIAITGELERALKVLDPELFKFLKDAKIFAALEAIGHGLDIASFLLDLQKAWAAMPGLPLDERIIYAGAFATAGLAIAMATSAAGKWVAAKAGAAVGSAVGSVVPVLGTAVGAAVGGAAAIGVSVGVDALADAIDLQTKAAELALADWQAKKAVAGFVVDVAGDVAGAVGDGAANVIGFVGDAASGVAGAVGDAASGVAGAAGDAVSFLNPFD